MTKEAGMNQGKFFRVTSVALLCLMGCTHQPQNGTTVAFKNGLCFVGNTSIASDVRPTVMVVNEPIQASQYLHVHEDSLSVGDAFVVHPDHPPEVPKFPIFVVSGSGQIIHVIGDRNAVPQKIADDAIPMAAAARHACQVAAQHGSHL
jgi:hypothetical protein